MKNLKLIYCLVFLSFGNILFASESKEFKVGPHTSIIFDAGKSNLTDESKEKLKTLTDEATLLGKIKEVQLAVWSDNSVPMKNAELSKADRELAKQRGDALNLYFKNKLNIKRVIIYNMAKNANWFEKIVENENAVLKSEITYDSDFKMSKEEFKIFRDVGKVSSAVVLTIISR